MEIGITGERTLTVTKEKLASAVGSGLVDVFSTPMMIAEIEGTAADSVAPFLDAGKTTVGTEVHVSHTAATPEGMHVHIHTELIDIQANGKVLTFKVTATDEVGQIGNGTHTRAIVDAARFMEKVSAKRA
ncbi:MAG: thioesterase family protein [Treponema sp.]|nr:thioesterase family protein [Treponema sp.]